MRNTCFRLLTACLCCCLLFAFFAPPVISADAFPVRRPAPDQENDPNDPDAAQNISGTGLVTEMSGFYSADFLFNGRKVTGLTSDGNVTLTLAHPDGIGWLYFIFLKEYGTYTVINNDTGDRVTQMQNQLIALKLLEGKPSGKYDDATAKAVKAFAAVLEKNGIRATVRRKLGADINASCGQLRKETAEREKA